MIIDNLLEQITLGLEQNDFKFNQRRVAEVKYLGELYNYKMVDSTVIFDTLYRMVTFGHRESVRQHCVAHELTLYSHWHANTGSLEPSGPARRLLPYSTCVQCS